MVRLGHKRTNESAGIGSFFRFLARMQILGA